MSEHQHPQEPQAETDRKDKRPVPEEQSRVSQHSVTIGGRVIDYSVTAGTLHIKDAEKDEVRATMFYCAYTHDGVENPAQRPITFCFNGGPGSSSVWLHLGAFGPRRVDIPDEVQPPPPPYALVDNAESILDLSDLVFIDPVDTGYSHPVGQGESKDFHGIKEDVASVAEFIRLYTTRNGRWNSPKLIAGESYGTTRAAALASKLFESGIALNGLVLVSAALNFNTFVAEPGNDLPHLLFLPGYAATAWFHDALSERPDALRPFLDEVRDFALGDYAESLLRGTALSEARRMEIARRLAAYTGLDEAWILRSDLRIPPQRFFKELLRERGQTVGRLDSRFLGMDPDPMEDAQQEDPSYTAPLGAYTALMQDYLRRELGYEEDRRYEILSLKVNEAWNWNEGKRMGYPNVVGDLRRAMLLNPHLKVFFGAGIYDLGTPYASIEHSANHLGAEAHLSDNVELALYEAGHMMYLHPPSRTKLKEDLRAFYASAAPPRSDA
jgi:carboxypeptidase C (cathepsin A)